MEKREGREKPCQHLRRENGDEEMRYFWSSTKQISSSRAITKLPLT
jgi:hypothetical protein